MTLDGAALAAWRDGIGYISQDPFLFHDTVRRNLAWASSQASEQEMWQALARAILRKPRLLVLDEATNAIDVQGEHVLFTRLQALKPRPTIVVIAHRPETLMRCGRVIRMEEGRIVA